MLKALLFVQALAGAVPDATIDNPDEARLAACLARVDADAEAGYEDARIWAAETHRWQAYVCAAVADIARGRVETGAKQLEALARASDAESPEARVRLFGQAGNAWLLARDPARAKTAFDGALAIAPTAADILIDRARAFALAGEWRAAEEDLSAALDATKDSPDPLALRLRAETRLRQGAYALAVKDAEAAVAASPADVEAAVMLGRAREALRLNAVPE